MATLINTVAGAFGGVSGGAGESGRIYSGVNSGISNWGFGANQGDSQPSAYLNYILFDQQYRVVTMGWTGVPATANFAKQKISLNNLNVKEAGYLFVYLSYETPSNNWVYFDDLKVTHTKTNIVQYNEYYPFGLQTANSWTRENSTGNNFLANGGTELNATTSLYDLEYRNYDPQVGRMAQVDPMASKYASLTPYNYSFNMPVNLTDPNGADPVRMVGDEIIIDWDEAMRKNGGTWYNDGGRGKWMPFNNGIDAYNWGVAYNDYFGTWSHTAYGSEAGSNFAYVWNTVTGSIPVAETVNYHLNSNGGSWEGALNVILADGWNRWQRSFNASARGGGPMPDLIQDELFSGKLFSFDRATEAFQFMWDNSFETRTKRNGKSYKAAVREVAAWITTEGILVQPWKGPLVDKNNKVISGYAANHIVRGEGAYSYNNFLPFDQENKTVMFNGRLLSIIAQIHTHSIFGPINSNQDNSLSGDLGIPIYNIHGKYIYDSMGAYFGTISKPSKLLFK